MRRCPSLLAGFWFLVFGFSFLLADINTGLDIRGRGYRMSNPEYGNPAKTERNFFEQRTRFYFEGQLKKGVSGKMILQNSGIWGRNEETEFFLNNANIKIKKIFGSRLTVKIGRQSLRLNDGLLINDDGNGFDGVMADAKLPLGIVATGISFKFVESSTQNFSGGMKDKDIYLLSLKKSFSGKNIFLNYFIDVDKSSGTKKHSLISFRYESALIKEVQWTIEIVKTIGAKKDFDTLAGFLRINALGDIAKVGKGGGFFVFATGSGDKTSTPAYEGFHPDSSFIGEWNDFGEYYMKNREENRSNSIENLQIMGGGLSSMPKESLNIFLNYFSYTLPEKNLDGEEDLGKEFDFGVEYSYTDNLELRLVFSRFSPGAATAESGSTTRQILFETNLTF